MTESKTRFRFTEEFDLHLAREVYGQNPFEDMKRWAMIQVNMIQITGKCVTIRTLRDRIQNLLRKYSIKAASLVGKSGIEILVTEMDDLLQQILELKNEEKRKSIPLSSSTQKSKSSYMKGHDARERSCSENNATYNAEVPLGNSRTSYPTDFNVPEQSCSDPGIDLICDTEIVVEDTTDNNIIEIKSNENSEANTFLSTQSTSQPITLKRKPLAQANILESPPPPYSRTNADRLKPEDRAPSEAPLVCRDSYPGSITTNGDSCMDSLEWCKLAYWEMSERVGPLYPVEPPAVNVFSDMLHPDGLSLETLAQHSFSPPEPAIQRTRCKIGLGITLSHEDDCVWVYNRSDHPIFVHSLALEDHDSSSPTRVPAEHCLCVYDSFKAAQQNFGWNFTHPQFGPVDPNSIRISFVKGWGPKYARREITSCPCWLEILLAPCR